MKIKTQILYGIEVIIACYIFFLATFIIKEYPNISIFTNIFFYGIMMMVALSFFTLKTHEKTLNKLVLKTIILDNLVYYLLLFMAGMFLGFARSPYSLHPLDILNNILPVILLVGFKELFRQTVIKNLKREKLSLIIFTLEIIILSLVSNMSLYSISTGATLFKSLGLFIIPTIIEELLLTYLAYNINYKVTITYSLFQKLWIYITPLFPDFSNYLQSVIYIVFPTVVFLQTARYILKYEKSSKKTVSSKTELFFTIPIMFFLLTLVLLISGITKYQIISVATGSMVPNINRGDAVIVRKVTEEEKKNLEEGQVIAFVHDNEIILHRIIKITKEENFASFIVQTKGDANKEEDPYELSSNDILGTINVKIPWIGYPTLWINGE